MPFGAADLPLFPQMNCLKLPESPLRSPLLRVATVADYFHSVRHLRAIQIYARLSSWLPKPEGRRHGLLRVRPTASAWVQSVERVRAQVTPDQFRFLNQSRDIVGPRCWNDPSCPRLWLYNLHYFDDLNAQDAESQRGADEGLMRRWIRENPLGQGCGWHSYPASLRIVNWIKWALNGAILAPEIAASLASQAQYLSRRLEYATLGNHIFENAKALVLAGCFFDGPDARSWMSEGLQILRREVPEQVLADGGHFERSPVYHAIFLDGVLDLVNLARVYRTCIPEDLVLAWCDTTRRMLGWLETMCHPDGEIALFNDAAFGIAPSLRDLQLYAQRLGVASCAQVSGQPPTQLLPQSGYARLVCGPAVLLFDGGAIGPDYQPGHAHADTLSFELSVSGRRIIVDAGTSTYAPGSDRSRERSTSAHNTVVVDGMDQTECWGAFRVARRARPLGFRLERFGAGVFVEAGHDGYKRLADPVIHRRRIEMTASGVSVRDTIEAGARHQVDIAWHFHPVLRVLPVGPNRFEIIRDGCPIASLVLDPKFTVCVAESSYHPEFGVAVPNLKVCGSWTGPCPAQFLTGMEWK
jgi:uncharacterized heparinase superfamily protein